MFEYFYNEIFRSVIIGFGSLFNGIQIQKKDEKDQTFSVIKVPLAYGPTQKFLARMQQSPDLNHPVQMTLPRMSFEFTALAYDPSRKSTQTQQIVVTSSDGSEEKKTFLPVPYNMTIVLSVYTKFNDDMLQITEQIVPYFQPGYTLPIKFLGDYDQVVNVPVVLENIDMQDEYEGNFDTRRALLYTFTFTAKTMVFGPLVPSLLDTREMLPIRSHLEHSKIMMEWWQHSLLRMLTWLRISSMLKMVRQSKREHTSMLDKKRCMLRQYQITK